MSPVRTRYAPPKSILKLFQIDFNLLKTTLRSNSYFTSNVDMVELVDTFVLGANAEKHAGSSPVIGTNVGLVFNG